MTVPSSLSSALSDIISASESVGRILLPLSPPQIRIKNEVYNAIDLPHLDIKMFKQQLASRNISLEVKTHLCGMLRSCGLQYRDCSKKELEILLQKLSSQDRSICNTKVVNLFKKTLLRSYTILQQALLEEVDLSITQFHVDAEVFIQRENELSSSSSDEEVTTSRGLPPLATKIFEAAYSRSEKITQAERDRLSEATGVPARSVTIWVSSFTNLLRRKEKLRLDKGNCLKRVGGQRDLNKW